MLDVTGRYYNCQNEPVNNQLTMGWAGGETVGRDDSEPFDVRQREHCTL
jgi:hypothetical protein